jgi:hypothetical protein
MILTFLRAGHETVRNQLEIPKELTLKTLSSPKE